MRGGFGLIRKMTVRDARGGKTTMVGLTENPIQHPPSRLGMSSMVPVIVLVLVTVTLAVTVTPCGTSADAGVIATVKSGPGGTYIVKLAEGNRNPLLPVTLTFPHTPILMRRPKTFT